jgi:2',3'-cyclic-nucleotide 2'-phosphodiesterase (5'-nucleotidase family)
LKRTRAVETLRRLRDKGAAIDESWHRTAELKRWRTDVENALVAVWPVGSVFETRLRSVRWIDDPDTADNVVLDAFHLAVEDTLTILNAAAEAAELRPPARHPLPEWLRLLLASTAAVAFVIIAMWYLRPPAQFKIMQISDLSRIEGLQRGAVGGLARVRSVRELLETEGRPVLVVNAGDTLSPSVMKKYFGGAPMIAALNLLDGKSPAFDPLMVATFGGHDFDDRTDGPLLEVLRSSQFRWVSTNVLSCREEVCEPFSTASAAVQPGALIDLGGTRVGVIGILRPMQKSYMRTSTKSVDEAIAVARAAAVSLRKRGARVVIALTQQEWADDLRFAAAVEEVDVVIGGHDHIYDVQNVGGRWVSKADADAQSVVIYNVTVPTIGRPTMTPLRYELGQHVKPARVVSDEIKKWLQRLDEKLGITAIVGTTDTLLEGNETAIRSRETTLGNLITDIAREQMRTDIAVINGGAFRLNDDIPPGPITGQDMNGIFYFANELIAFNATGKTILDMLNNSVSRVDMGDGRFLQVSGLKFKYHREGNRYIVRANDVVVGDRRLDLARTYSVATIGYLYRSGAEDGYTMFTDANRPSPLEVGRDFRTVVEEYLRRHPSLRVVPDKRIVFATQ